MCCCTTSIQWDTSTGMAARDVFIAECMRTKHVVSNMVVEPVRLLLFCVMYTIYFCIGIHITNGTMWRPCGP